MNHWCTYFDRGFLIQGLALWRSLAAQDADAVLWVLALDDFTAGLLGELGDSRLRIVPLAELERADPGLAAAKASRTRIEYYFTLTPAWVRWLLASQPRMERVTYLDADLFFFAGPRPIFGAMDAAGASVLITPHRFPPALRHYARHGKFNVGLLSFRNDPTSRAVLEDWRARCLAWCFDRTEEGKYADQKYLEDWPAGFGAAVLASDHPGVNLAPWNWAGHDVRGAEGSLHVDGQPLIVFHFARFRPVAGDRWWQSGQLDYGIMPRPLRHAVYGPYWRALSAARAEIAARRPHFTFAPAPARRGRAFWRALPLRVIFGGDWLRVGERFYNLRFGLGRFSGRALGGLRAWWRGERRDEGRSEGRDEGRSEGRGEGRSKRAAKGAIDGGEGRSKRAAKGAMDGGEGREQPERRRVDGRTEG